MAEHKSHNPFKGMLSSSREKRAKKLSESTTSEASRNGKQYLAVPTAASRRRGESSSHPESPAYDEASSHQGSEVSSIAPSDDEKSGPELDLSIAGGSFWEQAYRKLSADSETTSLMKDYDNVLSATKTEADAEDKDVDGAPAPAAVPGPAPKIEGSGGREQRPHVILGKEAEMQDLVARKLKKMQEKEWVVKWKGKEMFRVRKAITETVKIVQKFSDLASKAAGLDPLHAGLAWAGVSCVLPLIINDTEERTKAVDGVSSTSQITARYLFIERDYRKGRLGQDSGFEASAINLCSEILKFYAKAAVYFARNSWKKWLRNSFKIDDWTSALDAITAADQACQAFSAVLTSSTLLEGRQEIAKLLAAHEKENIQKMVAWVSDTKVGQQHQQFKEKLGGKYAGSGQWLLESSEFVSWRESSHGHFWLRGSVGTGKSSLVSIVIEHFKDKTENFAYFYCTNALNTPEAKEAPKTTILRALAAQLVLSPDKTAIAEEVKIEYEKSVNLGLAGSEPGYEQSLHTLNVLIASRDSTTIIIDALDECPDYLELLSALKTLDQQNNNLKLFLSSQLVVPVSTYLQLPSRTIGLNDNIEDIKTFINGEMEKFDILRPSILTGQLRGDILDVLSDKAGCMFKWAELTLKFLLDPGDEEEEAAIQENLDHIKERPNRGVLRQMAEAYEKLYKKHLPSDIDKKAAAMRKAEKVLGWIFVAARPLHLYEILCLADEHYNGSAELRKSADKSILKVCRSFVFVSEEEPQTIEMSHSSVSDFLALKLSGKVETLLKDSEGKVDPETLLQDAYMISKVSQNTRVSTESISYLLSANNVTIDTWAIIAQQSLIPYSAEFWSQHAKLAIRRVYNVNIGDEQGTLDHLPDAIRASIRSLLSPENQRAFENWLALHNPDQGQKKNKYTKNLIPRASGSQLYYAMILGFWVVASDMIDDGWDVDAVGGYFGTCLQVASYSGDEKTVSKLLERHPLVNTQAGIFGTALQAAAAGGHTTICSLLLDAGADVNIRGGLLCNPLQAALAHGSHELVQVLSAGITRTDSLHGDFYKTAFFNLSQGKRQELAHELGSRIAGDLPRGLTFEQTLLASVVSISSQARPGHSFVGSRAQTKSAKQRQFDMLVAQAEISAQIAQGNEMEEWYVYRQLPWVGFHLIFQSIVERISSDDNHYLNKVIKVMTKHEDFLVNVARKSSDTHGTISALTEVLTSMYELILLFQISFIQTFRQGKWRRDSRQARNAVGLRHVMEMNDTARLLEQTIVQSAIVSLNFGGGLEDMLEDLELITAETTMHESKESLPSRTALEKDNYSAVREMIGNEKSEIVQEGLQRKPDIPSSGNQPVEDDVPEQSAILSVQGDVDIEGETVGTQPQTDVHEHESMNNETSPVEDVMKETHENQSLTKEQDLRAEMAGMKTEMGLLREEMGELKGLVRKLLVVLETAGKKGGS